MKELWIKKTVYKRLLIEDSEIDEVKAILRTNSKECVDIITDTYDKNKDQEYDCEETILPISYIINEIDLEKVKKAINKAIYLQMLQLNEIVKDEVSLIDYNKSKECDNCKFHNKVKIGCEHPKWDYCIKRDKEGIVSNYIYHEYKTSES